jgi:hypothetical protein
MKRYFVKVISTAKASNKVHSGVVMCNVWGSGGVHIASTVISDPNSCLKNIHTFDNSKRSDIVKCGFTSRADAEKYRNLKSTLCNKFYDFDVSVITVDV